MTTGEATRNNRLGRKVGALLGVPMALVALTACNSGEPKDPATPLSTTSQIDKPTASQQPTNGELDPSQLECVGDEFFHTTNTGLRIVDDADAQRAYDCVKDAGQVKMTSTRPSFMGDHYGFDARLNGKIVIFSVSGDREDTGNFGILRVRE